MNPSTHFLSEKKKSLQRSNDSSGVQALVTVVKSLKRSNDSSGVQALVTVVMSQFMHLWEAFKPVSYEEPLA